MTKTKKLKQGLLRYRLSYVFFGILSLVGLAMTFGFTNRAVDFVLLWQQGVTTTGKITSYHGGQPKPGMVTGITYEYQANGKTYIKESTVTAEQYRGRPNTIKVKYLPH